MYKVLRSPSATNTRNIQQENNVLGKKLSQSTKRKPLGERSVNVNETNTPIVTKPNVLSKTVKKHENYIENGLFSEPCFYKCTYKDPKDTFNDLLTKNDILGKNVRKNIMRNILGDSDDTKLKPKIDYFPEPELIELEMNFAPEIDEFDFFKTNLNVFNFQLKEVPLPVLDF